MWKRVFALLALGSLALLLGFATRSEPANPPTDVERPAEK